LHLLKLELISTDHYHTQKTYVDLAKLIQIYNVLQ